VKDAKIGKQRIKAREIYEQRMSDAFWGIRENAANRNRLKKGDFVIFYLAGKHGQKFLGTCTLASEYSKLGIEEKKRFDHGPFFQANHGVKLEEVELWDDPLPIQQLLQTLRFVKTLDNWGSHLQGSIHAIFEEDYDRIVSSHEMEEIIEQSQKEPSLTEKSSFTQARRKARDTAFSNEVKEIYEFACAVCGKKRFTSSKYPEVESSHIYPKKKNGANDLRNGIALCKLHHWAFDNGLFSLKDDYSIVIEDRIKNDANYEEISRFAKKKIRLPKIQGFKPHPIFLKGHRRIYGFE